MLLEEHHIGTRPPQVPLRAAPGRTVARVYSEREQCHGAVLVTDTFVAAHQSVMESWPVRATVAHTAAPLPHLITRLSSGSRVGGLSVAKRPCFANPSDAASHDPRYEGDPHNELRCASACLHPLETVALFAKPTHKPLPKLDASVTANLSTGNGVAHSLTMYMSARRVGATLASVLVAAPIPMYTRRAPRPSAKPSPFHRCAR